MNEYVPVRRAGEPPEPCTSLPPEPLSLLTEFAERMRPVLSPGWATPGTWKPAVWIQETDLTFVFEVDLPGARCADVVVELRERDLCVSGEVPEQGCARRCGRFCYRSTLPLSADPRTIQANLDHGVLTIAVDKIAGD
ncbi:Hsp20/alpha crystallin family protein [Amycolatopsis acidicola]|uniref:Hsp20/alpha crystallin family protein n=1 Tax=Amycolatopsis acidicola TaxID=2596893 RepID=A0A5N0VJ34_9PSEU|nr:Hsp20/alpha crystallin family protein [Amycolatopsis acidicola]KAA9166319.1 Hsp20/alpha crystallin family protein [Amycolatopsis acidicola]